MGNMADNWRSEELEAAVAAYLEMRKKDFDGEKYSKKSYYRNLAIRFERTEKSFEYRMQNISYVFSILGRSWIKGLKPAKNVGANVASDIERIINKLENQSAAPVVQFQTDVSKIRKKKKRSPPEGSRNPSKKQTTTTQYERDAEVVAWLLDLANGACECCGEEAPFQKEGGVPYLEVHHLKLLADGGADTITNAIAVCPNCHKELHYGEEKEAIRMKMYDLVERLFDDD
jgi:5-methylcytosine-specific restriction enzyme A